MRPFDRYDTPARVAHEMVAAVDLTDVTSIADFAAGGGSLLRAAAARWPVSCMYAADVDVEAAQFLRKMQPGWRVSHLDFLSDAATGRSSILRPLLGSASLIVLNPPFSARGPRSAAVRLLRQAGTALAFVEKACTYLHPNGSIVAVLPTGALESRRDERVRDAIGQHHVFEVLRHLHRRTFRGAVANTAIVVIKRRPGNDRNDARVAPPLHAVHTQHEVVVQRGHLQMHRVLPHRRGMPLVHSTELLGGFVTPRGRVVAGAGDVVHGPAVLLPRVGLPSARKVSLLQREATVALSDCVIGLRCPDMTTANALLEAIHADWSCLAAAYRGTCAPYIRVADVTAWLQSSGFAAVDAFRELQDVTQAHGSGIRPSALR